MPSPFFSGRIPQELSDRIQQHCTETGESKTQVLLNALSKYLDFPIKPPATISISAERFDQLEQRVAELEKKLEITNVSSIDNTVIEVDQIDDNNIIEKPDNNLIQENEASDNSADIAKQSDNSDNTIDQAVEPDPTQLSIPDIGQRLVEVNRGDRKPWIVRTNEVPNLPGLEGLGKTDKERIAQKLRNAKATGKTEVAIEGYLLKYHNQEAGVKKQLLWEVITRNNKR